MSSVVSSVVSQISREVGDDWKFGHYLVIGN